MKKYILISLLMTMLFPAVAVCQGPEEKIPPEEMMEREIHMRNMERELKEREIEMRNMQLDLESREAEMEFEAQMRDLELAKHRFALEREKIKQKQPGLRMRGYKNNKMFPFVAICLIVHILLAVWVYGDIRKRNCGSGIWIVIVLLTGLLGAIPYTIARLGDVRQTKSSVKE